MRSLNSDTAGLGFRASRPRLRHEEWDQLGLKPLEGVLAPAKAFKTQLGQFSTLGSLVGSPKQYGTLINRTLKRGPNLGNYPSSTLLEALIIDPFNLRYPCDIIEALSKPSS